MTDEVSVTPLANDPVSLTDYASTIGLDLTTFQFAELFGYDEDVFAFIPKPIYSTLFLFPVGKDDGPIETRYQEKVPLPQPIPWYTKQTVGNACGTIAVLHSILNNLDHLGVAKDSWLEKFILESADKTPEERAAMIEGNTDLIELHEETATDDTTPLDDISFASHFIAFIIKDGNLWELDGRKPQPICHGPSSDLLKDSVDIVKRDFLPHIEDIMYTSMCAFCGQSSE